MDRRKQTYRQRELPRRKTIRLNGYDYSQAGLYFITVCTQNRLCLFGGIENGEMILNDAGRMIHHQWEELAHRFDPIRLHEFIVMPNHFHGIIEISVGVPLVGTRKDNRATTRDCPDKNDGDFEKKPTVGEMVGAFKSLTTNSYIRNGKQNDWPRFAKKMWQRNYYEHVIRDEKQYCQIAEYIQTNPMKWLDDQYYEKG